MIDFIWKDFYEIGIDFIDEDHKRLLDTMQEIQTTLEKDNKKTSIALLNRLISEAVDHFKREEDFLRKVEYPELEEHKIYHSELLARADRTKRICEGVVNHQDLKECFDGMAKFLIDDIFNGDIKFKSHLEFYGFIKNRK